MILPRQNTRKEEGLVFQPNTVSKLINSAYSAKGNVLNRSTIAGLCQMNLAFIKRALGTVRVVFIDGQSLFTDDVSMEMYLNRASSVDRGSFHKFCLIQDLQLFLPF